MKLFHALLAIMFMWFASLQLNDPDPVVWILIYGSMSVVCVMAIFEYYVPRVMIGQALLFVVYCIILWPGVSEWLQQDNKSVLFDDVMKMEHLYIEEAREFLGLVICLAVLAFYSFRNLRAKQA